MIGFGDLLPLWLSDNLRDARRDLSRAQDSYNSLKSKDSTYAKSIKTIINVREKVVELWDAAAKECGERGRS